MSVDRLAFAAMGACLLALATLTQLDLMKYVWAFLAGGALMVIWVEDD